MLKTPEIIKEIALKEDIGLSTEEAEKLIKENGENALSEGKKSGAVKIFAGQFKDVLVMILLASTVISVVIGEIYDAVTIILIVLINAVLGFIQEYKTERTLEALKNMTAPTAKVWRDGKLTEIPAKGIVAGDVFELEAGDRVPADAVIISSRGLFADEAILTGEAVPVEKVNTNSSGKTDALNLPHIVYMGTVITKGNARCKTVSTGMNTQMGKVSGMLVEIKQEDTPLQRKLAEMGKILAVICLVVCAIVALAGILRGEPVFDMLMTGITIAIAAIPEGLPATVTIALALAVGRMLKRNALVHKLHSVETLGCASVICSDKTGTITENRMTVQKIITVKHELDVTGTGYRIGGEIKLGIEPAVLEKLIGLNELLKCAVLCNNAGISKYNTKGIRSFQTSLKRGEWVTIGDPTEIAMLVAASKAGVMKEKLESEYVRKDEIPFDSETRCMKVIVRGKEGAFCYAKGAPDVILSQCSHALVNGEEVPLGIELRHNILLKNEKLATDSLRVLAFSYKRMRSDSDTSELVFLGLMGMLDPPRAEAKRAIRICEKANIKTVMITGDHKTTACAIASQAGIMKSDSRALTGEELSRLSDDELSEVIEQIAVFARVNPADKLRIVRAFKKKGHIVAMTGDGVNDAPAVKEADIGVSMGLTGTDVTKQAADVILLDDNFATLVSAVEQGRTIYSNIRKFVRYLLSCNIGEVMTMFVGILMGLPMVLLPTQILLVNLMTDGLPAVALGVEPTEELVMKKSPRKSTDGFFSGGLMTKIVFRGILIGLCTLGSFVAMLRLGCSVDVARTAALFTLIMSQLIHVFECKSEEKTLFTVKYLSNPFLILAVLLSGMITAAAIYLPVLQIVFSTVPLTLRQLGIAGAFSLAVPVLASFFNKK